MRHADGGGVEVTNSCPSKEYGCSCTDNCQSYSSRLAEINHAERTVMAKRAAGFAAISYFATSCVIAAAISLSFAFFTVPDGKRQALRSQENVHVARR